MNALAYVSTSSVGTTDGEVDRLAKAADYRNRQEGITGILVYNGRNFFQIIEGDRDPLYALLRRLNFDDRHWGVSVVWEQSEAPRAFPDWGLRTWRGASLDEVTMALPPGLDPRLAALARSFASLR